MRYSIRISACRDHRSRYRVQNRYRLRKWPSCLDSDTDNDPTRALPVRWLNPVLTKSEGQNGFQQD